MNDTVREVVIDYEDATMGDTPATYKDRTAFLEERIAQIAVERDQALREASNEAQYAERHREEAGRMRAVLSRLAEAETTAELRQAQQEASRLLYDLDNGSVLWREGIDRDLTNPND